MRIVAPSLLLLAGLSLFTGGLAEDTVEVGVTAKGESDETMTPVSSPPSPASRLEKYAERSPEERELLALKVRELKYRLRKRHGITPSGILDKEELVAALIQAEKAEVRTRRGEEEGGRGAQTDYSWT